MSDEATGDGGLQSEGEGAPAADEPKFRTLLRDLWRDQQLEVEYGGKDPMEAVQKVVRHGDHAYRVTLQRIK